MRVQGGMGGPPSNEGDSDCGRASIVLGQFEAEIAADAAQSDNGKVGSVLLKIHRKWLGKGKQEQPLGKG